MSRRTLIVLLVAFGGLVAIALSQTQQQQLTSSGAENSGVPNAQPTTNAEAVLSGYELLGKRLDMTTSDLSAIRLRDPELKLTFALSRDSSGNWTAPERDGVLDQTAANNIAKTVVLLPYEKTIEVKPDTALSDFGFIPDGIFSIEILLTNNISHAVVIGGFTPSGESYYGLVDDKKEIYVFERRAIDYLLIQLNKPPLT